MSPAHSAVNGKNVSCHLQLCIFLFHEWHEYLLNSLISYSTLKTESLWYISNANWCFTTISISSWKKLSAIILLLIVLLHFSEILKSAQAQSCKLSANSVQLILEKASGQRSACYFVPRKKTGVLHLKIKIYNKNIFIYLS